MYNDEVGDGLGNIKEKKVEKSDAREEKKEDDGDSKAKGGKGDSKKKSSK